MQKLQYQQQPNPKKRRMPGPWFCAYVGFVGHKKWRRIAAMTGVHLAFVHNVVWALFEAARSAARDGWIGSFDVHDCAAATGVPVADVMTVFRALLDIGWIVDDHIIDWIERQPSSSETEKTAERQRNKRARDKVARKIAAGIATDDEVALLDRLGNVSRVTAAQEAPVRPPVCITAFVPVDDDRANQEQARQWLFGDDSTLGIASAIIGEVYGIKPPSADWKMRRWADSVDVLTLAGIISAAFAREPELTRANFKAVVEQSIERAVAERAAGLPLPLGPARRSIAGGAA